MSELKKLAKTLEKTKETVEVRRKELDDAIVLYGSAVSRHAVALDAFEQAEVLEAARSLRGKKPEAS